MQPHGRNARPPAPREIAGGSNTGDERTHRPVDAESPRTTGTSPIVRATWVASGPVSGGRSANHVALTAIMPMASAPATSVLRPSPTWAIAPGSSTPRPAIACSKMGGNGLKHPTSSENDQWSKKWSNPNPCIRSRRVAPDVSPTSQMMPSRIPRSFNAASVSPAPGATLRPAARPAYANASTRAACTRGSGCSPSRSTITSVASRGPCWMLASHRASKTAQFASKASASSTGSTGVPAPVSTSCHAASCRGLIPRGSWTSVSQ